MKQPLKNPVFQRAWANIKSHSIAAAKPKTAIIVGDGVRYEIADFEATELHKHFKVDKQIMLADMPSETEHNMSALYEGNNEVLPLQKDREAINRKGYCVFAVRAVALWYKVRITWLWDTRILILQAKIAAGSY